MTRLRKGGKGRECNRKGCTTLLYGQQQVCDGCRHGDSLCKVKGCGKPHGGSPTTKLCPQCRSKSRGRKRGASNPAWTPEDDAKIREIYSKYNNREIGKMARVAFPGRPQWSVKRRATVIGAATVRKKEPPWTPEEVAYLQEIGWMVPERIALLFRRRGFHRTVTAIAIHMKRMRVREGIDGMTATGLADMLGVDNHRVVRWIEEGTLAAERAGTTGDNHDRWHISTAAIRSFLVANPEQYTLTSLERAGSKTWFMELVTGSQSAGESSLEINQHDRMVSLAGERMPLSALADVCGRDVETLVRRIDGLGMSVEQAAFGGEDIVDSPTTTELGMAIALKLTTIMEGWSVATIRKKVKDANVSTLLLNRLLAGNIPLTPPILSTVANLLGYDVRLELIPRKSAK